MAHKRRVAVASPSSFRSTPFAITLITPTGLAAMSDMDIDHEPSTSAVNLDQQKNHCLTRGYLHATISDLPTLLFDISDI